jgi:succinate dehydrogenase (ubiquinone) cytochrome b560 subunit
VTEKLTPDQEDALLVAQRKIRPVSPHLQIYDRKQTYFGASIWTRITGSALAGALYGYSIVYLASPLLGWHIESSALVEAFAGLGVFTKGTLKSIIAWPFVYHLFNGIRHLTYDMAWGFAKPTISKWATILTASSVVTALGLGFLW